MSTDLLKIQSLHDFIKTFIIYQICVFVMLNCSLLRLKFRKCKSQKCDVNFQNSLCHYSENRLTRIFLQINLCFIMRDAFESLRLRHFNFAVTLLLGRKWTFLFDLLQPVASLRCFELALSLSLTGNYRKNRLSKFTAKIGYEKYN